MSNESEVVLSGSVPVYASQTPSDPRIRMHGTQFGPGERVKIDESCQKIVHDLGAIVVAFPLSDARNRYILEEDLKRVISP